MGKGGSKRTTVGYAYKASVSYVIATRVDSLVAYLFNEETSLVKYLKSDFLTQHSNFTITPSALTKINELLTNGEPKPYPATVNDGITENAKTGLANEGNGSGLSKSEIHFIEGSIVLPYRTNEDVKYYGLSIFEFDKGFIGDNVSSLPSYNFIVNRQPRIRINGNFIPHQGIIDNRNNQIIISANPVMVILDILINLLKIPSQRINIDSFTVCATRVASEYIGINKVIDETVEASKIIEEINELIHGCLILQSPNNVFVYKLMRVDLDSSPIHGLNVINVDNIHDIEAETSAITNLYNTLSVEYTIFDGYQKPRTEKKEIVSDSLLAYHGIAKIKSIDLTMLWGVTAIDSVMSRLLTKYTMPLLAIKYKVSIFNFSLEVGDLVWFQPDVTKENFVPIRITKISGDSVYDEYFSIEGIQDVLHKIIHTSMSNFATLPPQVAINTFNSAPNPARLLLPSRENTDYLSYFILSSYPDNKPVGTYLSATDNTEDITDSLPLYTVGAITNINKSADWGKLVDRNSYIDVTVTQGFLPVINGTEEDVQRLTNIIIIGDEVISFRVSTTVDITTFRLNHFIRGVNDKTSDHNIGDLLWYYPDKGRSANPTQIITPTGFFSVIARANGEESPETILPFTYHGELETPYEVQGLKFANNTLNWSPRVRLKGARYRNIDLFVAGSEEGAMEGVFKVYKDGVLLNTTTSTSYSINENGFYEVSCFLSPYESNKEGVTVNVF